MLTKLSKFRRQVAETFYTEDDLNGYQVKDDCGWEDIDANTLGRKVFVEPDSPAPGQSSMIKHLRVKFVQNSTKIESAEFIHPDGNEVIANAKNYGGMIDDESDRVNILHLLCKAFRAMPKASRWPIESVSADSDHNGGELIVTMTDKRMYRIKHTDLFYVGLEDS